KSQTGGTAAMFILHRRCNDAHHRHVWHRPRSPEAESGKASARRMGERRAGKPTARRGEPDCGVLLVDPEVYSAACRLTRLSASSVNFLSVAFSSSRFF